MASFRIIRHERHKNGKEKLTSEIYLELGEIMMQDANNISKTKMVNGRQSHRTHYSIQRT